MSHQTHFGKSAEAAQELFVDNIFAIEDTFNRKDAITLLADCALERIPKEMAMHSIVKEIRDRYNDQFLPAPTIKQLDAFQAFLKHYKSRDILTDYQLHIIGTNNTPTPKTDIERQVDELKERVLKLEAIILKNYKN